MTEVIETFINSAIAHSEATEQGDYKTANKNYDKIVDSVKFLKQNGMIKELSKLFTHSNPGVRIWACTYSLEENEKKAKKALGAIAKENILHHSFTAKMTLDEWNSGNLKLDY